MQAISATKANDLSSHSRSFTLSLTRIVVVVVAVVVIVKWSFFCFFYFNLSFLSSRLELKFCFSTSSASEWINSLDNMVFLVFY